MITSGLVNLYTHDIDASVAFYRDLLGLTETFRTPREGTPDHVELAAGGFVLGLGSVAAAASVHGVVSTPGAPAMAVVLWCDDVDATYDAAAAAAATAVQEPRDAGNGNRTALLRDPDGTLVELVAKRD
ncbi:VOC family protein [Nocardioides sp.]|uniref:VOC family protein n=1 Tax=Nocardioides sp. TaxID=35761 RepID=UPI0037831089